MKDEASYICDSCGEEVVVPIDFSARSEQEYVEDCPVCCRPNVIRIEIDDDGDVRVWTEKNKMKFLRSDRTVCRAWTLTDLPLALQLWGDAEVARYIDARIHLSESQIRERLLNEIANLEQHGVQYWPAFLNDGDMFIGCCGLKPYKPELNLFEFGFHLCRSFWGQGYATELGRAVIRHAFYDLKLPALVAGHHPDNIRSRRVLEKLGFRYTHDEFYALTGVVEPCYRLDRESASA